MRIIEDTKLDYSDVLISPKRSSIASRSVVKLERMFTFKSGNSWFGVPIIAANMDGVGTFEMDHALHKHRCMVALTKHYRDVDLIEHFKLELNSSIYSLGISDSDINKFDNVYLMSRNKHMRVCIDVANGYTQQFVEFVKRFRDRYPFIVLMAGNVVTPEMTEELILSGVDIVKVGIGPGSVCTTRIQTGVGYPQLSAVIECADAAHGLGGHIIADGGCTCPGDVAKAFGAGADFVMLGGMLAGHDEGGGKVVEELHELSLRQPNSFAPEYDVKKFVEFYGMSSHTAMTKHSGGVADYRSSEGKQVKVKYKGKVDDTIKDILGSLRSACTYVGAREIKEMPKRTTFVKVGKQANEIFSRN
jgi:GMP reductase